MARNQEPRSDANVMLLGMTGSGKSLLGNKLLGLDEDRYIFEVVDRSFAPRTTIAPQRGFSRNLNFSLTIIDTPGFFDNEHNIENKWIDVLNGVELVDGRLDAIIIVINTRRMNESVSVMELIMKDFGNVTRKIIVVFTNFGPNRGGFDEGETMRTFNETYGHGTAGITFIFSDQMASHDLQMVSHENILEAIRSCTALESLQRIDFAPFCRKRFKNSLSRKVQNTKEKMSFRDLNRHQDLHIELVGRYLSNGEIQQILNEVNDEISRCIFL